jgi:hypothetical protein
MIIPSLFKIKVADKDGNIHPDFMNFLTQLIAPLQNNFSNEGFTMPALTNAQILQIAGAQTQQRIIYNTDTSKMMLNNNGTFQTINVT